MKQSTSDYNKAMQHLTPIVLISLALYNTLGARKKKMVTMKKRVITINKISLHDETHHSFILGLTGDELFKMMTSMTAQHYFEIHGKYPPRLDRTKISFRDTKV